MFSGAVVVTSGEIDAGDGLGYGHGLAGRDALKSGRVGIWHWEKWLGIDDGAVVGVFARDNVEGLYGSNSEREVSFAVSAGGNGCTRERNWREYDGGLCNSWRCG